MVLKQRAMVAGEPSEGNDLDHRDAATLIDRALQETTGLAAIHVKETETMKAGVIGKETCVIVNTRVIDPTVENVKEIVITIAIGIASDTTKSAIAVSAAGVIEHWMTAQLPLVKEQTIGAEMNSETENVNGIETETGKGTSELVMKGKLPRIALHDTKSTSFLLYDLNQFS